MNNIIVITTEGCYGCTVIRNLLEQIDTSKFNINIQYIDCLDYRVKSYIQLSDITDFPTILFIKDNNIIKTITGTTTKRNLEEIISLLFS